MNVRLRVSLEDVLNRFRPKVLTGSAQQHQTKSVQPSRISVTAPSFQEIDNLLGMIAIDDADKEPLAYFPGDGEAFARKVSKPNIVKYLRRALAAKVP
jgi:hypothetical protein